MRNPDSAYRAARTGNQILNVLGLIVLAVLLAFASFHLYDSYALENEGLPEKMMKFKPDEPDSYSFAQLREMNPDVIGWIDLDGTKVDQPVLQGKDDMTYINTNPLGEFALTGSIFLSAYNEPDFSNPYNLLHGHHIKNGGMFGDLERYLKQDFFDQNTTGYLMTPDGKWNLYVFAALQDNAFNDVLYFPDQYDGGDLSSLISYLKEHAVCYRDPGMSSGEEVLGMSTCYDARTNERILVFAKMTWAGSDTDEEEQEWVQS